MYNRVREDQRAYKLMYKAFELSLSRPTNSQIAKTILLDNECNEIQSENNLSFLSRIRGAIFTFLQRNKLDYRQHNNIEDNPKCECDYDCECYLNKFIMPAFKNLALSFEPYMNDGSLVSHILEEYTAEEKDRLLSCDLKETSRLMLYKELAYLAFDNGFYDVACWHHEATVLMYGGSIAGERFNPSEYVENELSARNKKASDARWQPHREERKERKKKYLKIMKDKEFRTYADTATYIKQHIDTDSKPSHPTVCRLLSEADKGDFS